MLNQMSLALAHARWMTMELMRQPSYIVSTIAFPALFYLIFAVPESKSAEAANFLMASFAGFAVFGVVFLQFGVGLAQERTRSWYQFLKTLPVPSSGLLIARFLTSWIYGALAAVAIFVLASVLTPMGMAWDRWLVFVAMLFFGGLVFCFMGLALGYWTSEKAALPIGNLIYLPLSFVGGLWKPPEILPDSLKTVSSYLPTRFYGNLLWSSVKGESLEARNVFGLALYLAACAALAYWGFLRDSDRRLRQ